MTSEDLSYIRRLTEAGVLSSPVLELGTGWTGSTSKEIITGRGLTHVGTDLEAGPGVDVEADFENQSHLVRFNDFAPFGSVLVLNVLEHTFDPIRVLDHAISILQPKGTCVVITPAIWPLHNFPMDAWRIMPNFYEQYAARRNLVLDASSFEYVGFGPVSGFHSNGEYLFPKPSRSSRSLLYGRAVHKLFNTFGRGMVQPSHVAIGAVFHLP